MGLAPSHHLLVFMEANCQVVLPLGFPRFQTYISLTRSGKIQPFDFQSFPDQAISRHGKAYPCLTVSLLCQKYDGEETTCVRQILYRVGLFYPTPISKHQQAKIKPAELSRTSPFLFDEWWRAARIWNQDES